MIYTLFAGCNGTGKSTLFHSIAPEDRERFGIRVNIDDIIKMDNEKQSEIFSIKAGKKAINIINDCFYNKQSFHQETTLSGFSSIRKRIGLAQKLGYDINVYYISVMSPAIAIERVKSRVLQGGHNIDDKHIIRRFYTSHNNLIKLIPLANKLEIYDNTVRFTKLYEFNAGKLVYGISQNTYLEKILKDYKL